MKFLTLLLLLISCAPDELNTRTNSGAAEESDAELFAAGRGQSRSSATTRPGNPANQPVPGNRVQSPATPPPAYTLPPLPTEVLQPNTFTVIDKGDYLFIPGVGGSGRGGDLQNENEVDAGGAANHSVSSGSGVNTSIGVLIPKRPELYNYDPDTGTFITSNGEPVKTPVVYIVTADSVNLNANQALLVGGGCTLGSMTAGLGGNQSICGTINGVKPVPVTCQATITGDLNKDCPQGVFDNKGAILEAQEKVIKDVMSKVDPGLLVPPAPTGPVTGKTYNPNPNPYIGYSGYTPCLVGDAAIDLADGTRIRLDRLKIGDRVLSIDMDGQVTNSLIGSISSSPSSAVVALETSVGMVRATFEHKFLVQHQSSKLTWKNARDLRVGDVLLNVNGSTTKFAKIESVKNLDQEFQVYSVRMAEGPQSMVASGIAVHSGSLDNEANSASIK